MWKCWRTHSFLTVVTAEPPQERCYPSISLVWSRQTMENKSTWLPVWDKIDLLSRSCLEAKSSRITPISWFKPLAWFCAVPLWYLNMLKVAHRPVFSGGGLVVKLVVSATFAWQCAKDTSELQKANLKIQFWYCEGNVLQHLSLFFSVTHYRSKLLRGHSSDTSGPGGKDRRVHNLLLHVWGGNVADRASGHLQ